MRINAGSKGEAGAPAESSDTPEASHPTYKQLWTEERKNELRTLWMQGMRGIDIAPRFGCTANQVNVMAHRLNLPRHALLRSGKVAPVLDSTRLASGKLGRDQSGLRSCLCCGSFFTSEHAGNRLCRKCLDNE